MHIKNNSIYIVEYLYTFSIIHFLSECCYFARLSTRQRALDHSGHRHKNLFSIGAVSLI